MKITKITFEDGTESEFKELPLQHFQIKERHAGFSEYRFKNQLIEWEKENILENLVTDIEDYAKDEYSLIDEDDCDCNETDLGDFSDKELLSECLSRNLTVAQIDNRSIINDDFIDRIVEISRRGDDNYIDSVLESLEKLYRIK